MKRLLQYFGRSSLWSIKFLASFLIFGVSISLAAYFVAQQGRQTPIQNSNNNTAVTRSQKEVENTSQRTTQNTQAGKDTASSTNQFLAFPTNNTAPATYIDCIGPDGKTAYASKKDCDTLLSYWAAHPPPTAPAATSASSNASSNASPCIPDTTYNYYVDSTNGSNANSGKNSCAPFKTLAAVVSAVGSQSNNLCRDPQSFKTGGECMPGAKASSESLTERR